MFVDKFFEIDTTLKPLLSDLQQRHKVALSGLVSSAKPFLLSLLPTIFNSPILLITSDATKAESIAAECSFFTETEQPLLTENEQNPESVVADLVTRRARNENFILTLDLASSILEFDSTETLKKNAILLKKGMELSPEVLSEKLVQRGFVRKFMVEKFKDFAIRGGLLDLYPPASSPVRIEFFGNEIESIREFSIETQRSRKELEQLTILAAIDTDAKISILDSLNKNCVVVLDEPPLLKLVSLEREEFESEQLFEKLASYERTIELSSWGEDGDRVIDSGVIPLFSKAFENLADFLNENRTIYKNVIVTSHASRVIQLLDEASFLTETQLSADRNRITVIKASLKEGFRFGDSLNLITDKELFGAKLGVVKKVKKEVPLKLEDLKPGDYVIHATHGIGLYRGLELKDIAGTDREFLRLEYAGGDKLFLPIDQIYMINRMSSDRDALPTLSKMGGKEWSRVKAKVKEDVEKTARELLELYARREKAVGFQFSPDTPWQGELEESFPYIETEDQLKAIEAAKKDMERARPMERLICGDAGYGKTEVALRCAFKAAMDGKQSVLLAPTTLLAEQHYQTFSERFAPFPIKCELLSRFRTPAELRQSLVNIASGEADVIIGTHRVLSKDVKFKNLGLLIIDEEQQFGVIHKEKLKKFAYGVDTLILSATPIPRTLQLTVSGIKDLSVISTPPVNRLPIKTYIFPYANEIVKGAIMREKGRGGQVFFLHNRIDGIESVARRLQALMPTLRIATAHGRMDELVLEDRIKDFLNGEYDILVCTSIIQSGIDMPNVNTIIINNAYGFGLTQLYQIRGRVGRSHNQAYAYLLYPPHRSLTDNAKARMEILKDFTELGSGFHVAMKDLELRGAGEILGKSQSGFIESVGFELYCRMLNDAVRRLKGDSSPDSSQGQPQIELPVAAYIPKRYIDDEKQKLTIYRRIVSVTDRSEIKEIKEELKDRFGPIPEELLTLLDVAALKLQLTELLIPKVGYKDKDIFMLSPFLKPLSKTSMRKIRQMGIPFDIENNRITLYGILEDEYWMELLSEFLTRFQQLSAISES